MFLRAIRRLTCDLPALKHEHGLASHVNLSRTLSMDAQLGQRVFAGAHRH